MEEKIINLITEYEKRVEKWEKDILSILKDTYGNYSYVADIRERVSIYRGIIKDLHELLD